MTLFKATLLVLIFTVLQLFARGSAALPVVVAAGQQTDRFGPHSFPGWIPVGDKVQVLAFVDSSDAAGSPTISVQATQGGTSLALDYVGNHPLFEPFPVFYYYSFIDLDPGLTGSWQITATDSTGTGLPAFSEEIIEPEFLPLVEDIAVQGTPLGASVSWTLPNLDSFDVDDVAVQLIDATSGSQLWQSDSMPVETTSFEPPAGVLEVGVSYVYGIILGDLEGPFYENLSWAFSQPFRLTVAGDYNQNGTVDAGDYTVWRDNIGGGALLNRGVGITGPVGVADYGVWKANFGESLGTGSGAAGYPLGASAGPLSPAVPEPAAVVVALVALGLCPRRVPRRSSE